MIQNIYINIYNQAFRVLRAPFPVHNLALTVVLKVDLSNLQIFVELSFRISSFS